MIQGILELTNSLKMTYYFVSVHKHANILIVHSLTNSCKPLNKQILLADIDTLTYQYSPSESFIRFNYQGEQYRFVDYGHPLFLFLKEALLIPLSFERRLL